MSHFLAASLMHAAVASLLVFAALAVCRVWRNPFINRGVWLAALLKFIVPPLVLLPLVRMPQFGLHDPSRPTETTSPAPLAGPRLEEPLVGSPSSSVASKPRSSSADRAIDARGNSIMATASAPRTDNHPTVDPILASGHGGDAPGTSFELPSLTTLAAVAWLAGAAALLAMALRRIAGLHAALARSRVASHGWQRRTRRLAATAGLKRPPLVRLTAGRTSPLAWRLWRRSTVVLPAGLVAGLSVAEVDAILAHEVMHLRRRDDRLRWLELAVVAAWWWCPLAWLARRRLHEAEERCCDADVLRMFPAAAAHYARALLATLDFVAPAPPLAVAGAPFMDRGSLVRRFEMITSRRWPAPPTRRLRTLLLATCGALLVTTPVVRSVEAQPDNPDEVRVAIPKEAEPPASAIAGPDDSTPDRPALSQPNQQDAEPSDVDELHSSDRPVSLYRSNGDRIVGHWQTDGESLVFVPDDPLAGRLRLAAGFLPHNKTTTTGSTPKPASPGQHESFRIWDLSLRECLDIGFANAWFLELTKQDDGSAIVTRREHWTGAFIPLPEHVADTIVEVSDAYWELQFAYRELDARKIARDHALATWRQVKTLQRGGAAGGEGDKEALVRAKYYERRAAVEVAFSTLFDAENRLRRAIGLAASDGRLIRPIDEPGKTPPSFDWEPSLAAAKASRPELVRQRIAIAQRQRELEDAQKGLDADDGDMTDLQRRQRTAFVRQCELLIERDQAVIDDLELEVSEQLRSALRDAMTQRGMLETNGRRREAAADEVDAVETLFKVGQIDLDRVLDAQARLADHTAAFYRSAIDFERATMKFEFQKGATLERFGYRVK